MWARQLLKNSSCTLWHFTSLLRCYYFDPSLLLSVSISAKQNTQCSRAELSWAVQRERELSWEGWCVLAVLSLLPCWYLLPSCLLSGGLLLLVFDSVVSKFRVFFWFFSASPSWTQFQKDLWQICMDIDKDETSTIADNHHKTKQQCSQGRRVQNFYPLQLYSFPTEYAQHPFCLSFGYSHL